MPGIGETLRESRMRQRLDIADVEGRTKIRAKYLRALENEEFGLLPGPTFVKTFLRTYAEVLGLDPHVLVEEYRQRHEPADELDQLQPLASPPVGGRGGWRPPAGLIAVLAVLAVVIFLIVLGSTGGDDSGSKSAKTSTGQRAKKARAKARARPTATVVSVQLKPQVPTYVCVDTGPGATVVFQGTLSQARSFRAKRVRVNLGKTSVALRVNGKAFRVPAGANPVGYEFTPRGSRPLPPGQRPCQ